VRIELLGNWEQQTSDEELLEMIQVNSAEAK